MYQPYPEERMMAPLSQPKFSYNGAYYEAKRLEQEALQKHEKTATGLLLPPHGDFPIQSSGNGNGCSCKKSKCLKLYCACFSGSLLCGIACKCEDCYNTVAESGKQENAIVAARRAVLERNPKAFVSKIGGAGYVRNDFGGSNQWSGAPVVGPPIEMSVVRPVARVAPARRMPDYDFQSLENSASPKEHEKPILTEAKVEEPKETAGSLAQNENSLANTMQEESKAPEQSKVGDNSTLKSEESAVNSEQPSVQADASTITSFESNSRPVLNGRNHSPHDSYYRASPTYRPNYWDARQYPREMEHRGPYPYQHYYDHAPAQAPHHYVPDSRIPQEMPSVYQYRSYEPSMHMHQPMVTQKQHRVGCKCKKSLCLKKYCECFSGSMLCGTDCKCINCGNQPGGMKTNEAVSTVVSLGQSGSMEGEETPNLHVVSEDKEPTRNYRPPSLPSLASTNHDHNEEESLKENAQKKTSEQGLDFLAALATSELGGLSRDGMWDNKRKAEEIDDSGVEGDSKRTCTGGSHQGYYENSNYHSSQRLHPSFNNDASVNRPTPQAQMLTSVTKQINNVSTKPSNTKATTLPKGLTFRKVCSGCGRQRAEHGEFGFGNKCPLTTCGKCGADAACHQSKNIPMGVMCTLTESDGAIAGHSKRYEAMLADLAARAEIRAEMGRSQA